MALSWKVMYRLGMTPWEEVSEPGEQQLDRLFRRECDGDPPYGKALDIGCGQGGPSCRLAKLGWQPTGIDFVPLAIKRAKARAAAEGVHAQFVVGDVTQLSTAVGTGYRLLLDVGCFHLLSEAQQAAYAREIGQVSDSDAVLLLFAFVDGTRRPMPPGMPQERVEAAFPEWKLSDVEDALLPPRLQRATARWYRFQRR